ncbi:MAG: EamA family transporter [Candidatus Woesearchaeota archaeon]
MTLFALSLVVAASVLAAFGSFFLKKGSKNFSFDIISIFKNLNFLFGVFLYFLTTIVFIYALTKGDLSILYPVMSLSYVWVAFLSIKFLKEKMNLWKWLGIALIIAGVVFITF